ncbi:MAG: HipA family kinase [Reyranella sp.]
MAENDNPPTIELAAVLDGLRPRPGRTYSATYIGLVLDGAGATHQAIIKDLPIRDLVRELVGASIARRAQVAVPRCFLAVVEDAALSSAHGPMYGANRRLVFASQLVPGEQVMTLLNGNLPAKVYAALISWPGLPSLFAFDTWVANIDRHAGNIMARSSTDFCAIDHGHCFNGPWTNVADLDAAAAFRNRLAEWLIPQMSPDAKLTFLGAIANLPREMLEFDVGSALDQSLAFRIDLGLSRAKLLQFLNLRRTRLSELSHEAFGRRISVSSVPVKPAPPPSIKAIHRYLTSYRCGMP